MQYLAIVDKDSGLCAPATAMTKCVGTKTHMLDSNGNDMGVLSHGDFSPVKGWGDLDGPAFELLLDGKLIGYAHPFAAW